MHAAEPFPHFVDDYLSYLYEAHPTSATWTGSTSTTTSSRTSAARPSKPIGALAGFARRLEAIPVDDLPPIERVEHAHRRGEHSLPACSRSRQVRSWERNPQHYAETLASSLAAQAIFAFAPEAERARRVLSKLRQVPRLDPGRARQRQGAAGDLRQGRHRHPEGRA